MKFLATLVTVAALATVPNAFAADESGFYIGIDGGVSRSAISQGAIDQFFLSIIDATGVAIISGDSSFDDQDTTFGGTIGYKVMPWLAIEASYVDLGEASYQADVELTDGVTVIPFEFGLNFEASGPTLSALVILDQERYELFARGGFFFADLEATGSVSAMGESESVSASDSTQEFFWGIGAGWHFAKRWTARLEYQEYAKVGNSSDFVEADIETLTLGVIYRF